MGVSRRRFLTTTAAARAEGAHPGHLLRGQGNSVIVGELTITRDGGEVRGVAFLRGIPK